MSAALRRLRADLLADTMSMTSAQATAVAAQIASHPISKIDPAAAMAVAAEHGFPVVIRPPAPGLATAIARHLKG